MRSSGELPPGWEMRHNPNGRAYYIDHNSRKMQTVDPRIGPNANQLEEQ